MKKLDMKGVRGPTHLRKIVVVSRSQQNKNWTYSHERDQLMFVSQGYADYYLGATRQQHHNRMVTNQLFVYGIWKMMYYRRVVCVPH